MKIREIKKSDERIKKEQREKKGPKSSIRTLPPRHGEEESSPRKEEEEEEEEERDQASPPASGFLARPAPCAELRERIGERESDESDERILAIFLPKSTV